MRRATLMGLAALATIAAGGTAAGTASAQTVHRAASTAPSFDPAADRPDDGDGLNAFFYPDGYDPQYGSQGRLPDAADFAAGYGCLPVWDGKYGQYVEACNR